MLHHVFRDGEQEKGGSCNFPLGYKAAHHWSARLVVRGIRDTMEAIVPRHLANRHSHTGGVGDEVQKFKAEASLKTHGGGRVRGEEL